MKGNILLLAIVLILGGAVIYSIVAFKTSVEHNFLRTIESQSDASTSRATTTEASWRTTTQTTENACLLLPPHMRHASALSLWTESLDQIHNASQILSKDPDYEYHDLMAQLLHLVSPRLPNSVKAIPSRDWSSVQHVLGRVVARWNYIITAQQQQQQHETTTTLPPPPIKIVVMGGSVVSGVNCLQIFSKKVKHSTGLSRQQCAWPYRLQNFLDRMVASSIGGAAGSDDSDPLRLFQVHTVVMGGSNTISGNAILEFDLLPPEAKHPDIIIHAYATNDMHLQSFSQGDDSSNSNINNQQSSWREKVMTVLQDFIRLAHSSNSAGTCTPPQASTATNQQNEQQQQQFPHFPPVVMHLDDYLGNEQRAILATTELSQAVSVLASYYGTLTAMSYPDMVRDWVYGDTHEFWFSPYGWYPPYKQNKQQMAREIHPGMPAHIVVPWIISYHMLNLLTNYCDRNPYAHDNNNKQQSFLENIEPPSKTVFEDEYNLARDKKGLPLPALKHDTRFPGRPKVTPHGLPPPLDATLSLQQVSGIWKNQSMLAGSTTASDNNNIACALPGSLPPPKCPFAWVSGLLNDHNRLEERDVETYFRNQSIEYYNHGWEVKRHVDGKKMGFVPQELLQEQPGANLTIIFQAQPSLPFRQVVLFYLKSYGKRWDRSRLQVQLDRQVHGNSGGASEHGTTTLDLVGFHGKKTSEMFTERMVLQQPADRLRFQARLVDGKMFKIMGLLVCR